MIVADGGASRHAGHTDRKVYDSCSTRSTTRFTVAARPYVDLRAHGVEPPGFFARA